MPRKTASVCARFQSTLSMRRATGVTPVGGSFDGISIHALHEESDPPRHEHRSDPPISIHALHEESDFLGAAPQAADRFQSTLSMRRATSSPSG